ESAPWRLTQNGGATIKQRVRSVMSESLGRFFVSRADLSVFMHPGYKDTLFRNGKGKALVVPASWIDEHDILSDAAAEQSWAQKAKEPPRFLFAGRLTHAKGVDVLLDALTELEANEVPVALDVIGAG